MIEEERIKRELHEHPVPLSEEAEERSWALIRAAFDQEDRSPHRARLRSRLTAIAGSLIAAGAILGLVLTPAGATVTDWVQTAVGGSGTVTQERPALTHVPSGGRLLVGTAAGQWLVAEDGSRRFLGDFQNATWSPGGLYVGVSDGSNLTALFPGWNQPTGRSRRPARWRIRPGRRAAAGSPIAATAAFGSSTAPATSITDWRRTSQRWRRAGGRRTTTSTCSSRGTCSHTSPRAIGCRWSTSTAAGGSPTSRRASDPSRSSG